MDTTHNDSRSPRGDGIWFRAKAYGWGWTPVTWQGWAATLTGSTVIGVTMLATTFAAAAHPLLLVATVPLTVVAIAGFVALCRAKGEPARWRWGRR